MAEQPAGLQRGALGLTDVVFQGITHIAPAMSVVFILPPIAKKAGAAMPLSLAFSVIICFFIANTVAQFSRYVPSSGGYYTFVTRGLGPRFGFLATWSYLIYDVVGPAAALGYLGYVISDFLKTNANVNVPWWSISLAATLIVWTLTYFGIRISSHTMAALGAMEILIMLGLGVTFLLYPAEGSSLSAPLNPATSKGWIGVLAGTLFSILALSGFEAPAPLAQETKRPTSFIYLAIFTSLVLVGVFYVFMAYASAVGWGTGNMDEFAEKGSEAYNLLEKKVWGEVGQWVVLFAILNSALAVGIACTNAASRVAYVMAQTGTLPAPLKKIHPIHKTPYVAIHVLQVLQIGCYLLAGFFLGPKNVFECLATIVALAVIVLYVLANFALTVMMRRERPTEFGLWRHGIVPTVGTLFMIPATVCSILDASEYPANLMPYLFLVLMIVGFVVMKVVEAWRTQCSHHAERDESSSRGA